MLNLISARSHISSISEISDWMKSFPSVGQSTLLWTAALAGTDMYFLGFIFFEVALFLGFLTPEWFSWNDCFFTGRTDVVCPYLALSAIATLFATGFYRTQTLYFPCTFKQTSKWNSNLLVSPENVPLMQEFMVLFQHMFSDIQTEEYKSHQFSLPRTENADCCPDYYPHCLGSDEPQWVRLPSIMTMIRMMVHHINHLHPKYWEFVHVLVIHYHVHNFVQVLQTNTK